MKNSIPNDDDPAEARLKRQHAVDFGRASVGLSGFKITQEEEEAHAQRFIDGEITLKDFVGAPGKA